MNGNYRRLACSAGAIAIALLSVSPAFAQDKPVADQVSDDKSASTEGDAIVVTGTRLQRPNFTSNSPLTVVDATEIRYQGAIQVENVLNRLPQVTPDSNENGSNGSDAPRASICAIWGATGTLCSSTASACCRCRPTT